MASRVLSPLALAVACSVFASAAVGAAQLLPPLSDEPSPAVDPSVVLPNDQSPIRTIEDSTGQKRQFDSSGIGVLCFWNLVLIAQAYPQRCGWSAVPADGVLSDAIGQIEGFIVANSSTPVTLEQLAVARQRLWDQSVALATEDGPLCDIASNDGAAIAWEWRKSEPNFLRKLVQGVLSIPREPVMNPCL